MMSGHLYECGNCKARRIVRPKELNRAAKPYCYKCGSTILSPASQGAHEAILVRNANTGKK